MPTVLVTDNLSPAGLEVLKATDGIEVDVRTGLSPEEVKEALHDADGIIIRSGTTLTEELLAGQSRLKAIVRAGVGVDNIDREAATREGIVVMNTPAGNTTSTAEHTIAMMMSLSRNIPQAAGSMREGRWDRKKYTGTQLAGKTLAVIGLGRIGLSVAQRAQGLEMKVIGYDPFLSEQRAAQQGIELYRDVDDIIGKCDFLTVHTPMTPETRGIINADRLAAMKPGARIINCARGGIVDEQALADAIASGHIGGAALDVFVEEPPEDRTLVDLPQVIATPHLGASTDEAQELVAVEAAEIISGFLLNNEIRHAVNMAPVSGAEMDELKPYLDLSHRLGLLVAQQIGSDGIKSAKLVCRGESAELRTNLIGSSFASGLLSSALVENINIVNADTLARDRGIDLEVSQTHDRGTFANIVSATVQTDSKEISVAATMFGREFLRLVRLDQFQLDAYLDGCLLLFRHRDVPGLIGFVGTILGNHGVNIAHMALGRANSEQGGDAVAVLNLDSEPSAAAIDELAAHEDVTGIEVVRLPPAGAQLPWFGAA